MPAMLNFPIPALAVAPNLTWESTSAVNPPLLVVGLQLGIITGDHVIVEKSNAISDGYGGLMSDGTWTTYLDLTIADGAATDQSATAATLATGFYMFRARTKRSTVLSPWGTEQNITIGTPVVPWTPVTASTPAAWWIDASKASSITKTGTAPNEVVTQIKDISTHGRDMTPNGTGPIYVASAVNSKPGLSFISGGNLRTASFGMAQPMMLVMVWRQTGTVGDNFAELFYGDRALVVASCAIVSNKWGATAGNVAVSAGTAVSQGVAAAINMTYHSRIILNGSSSSSKLNASVLSGINPGTGAVYDGLSLGAAAAGNRPNAIICEAYIIPNPTAGDITSSDAFILAKWGLS
jgi:hypothetical protein